MLHAPRLKALSSATHSLQLAPSLSVVSQQGRERPAVCGSQEATSPLAAAEAARADKGTTEKQQQQQQQQQHAKEEGARSVEWGGGPGVGGETMALPSAAEAEAAVRSEATWVTGRWVDTTGGGEDRTLDRFGWLFEVTRPA